MSGGTARPVEFRPVRRVCAGMTEKEATTYLRGRVDPARVLNPGDHGYAEAVRVWNGAVTARPALVVRSESVDDVRSALEAARVAGLPVSVKGGGHDWAGRSVRSGGLTVDLSGLRYVAVDRDAQVATMGGGTTAADLIDATTRHGLVTATGTSAAVSMAGLAMGGGYGPGTSAYGLALDNLLSAEVVLADGRVVTADEDNEPDLFWALRGGGGNFGVVTSLRMRLHQLDTALAGFLMFSPDDAASVWSGIEHLLADAPDGLSIDSGLVTGPDGSPAVLVSPTWIGDAAEGKELLAGLDGLGTVYTSRIGPAPWAGLIGFVDSIAPAGRHYAVRTRNVPGFTDDVMAVLAKAGASRTTPESTIALHCFRGAAARVAPDATAFTWRVPHFMVEVIGSWWPDDREPDRHRQWVERTTADLSAHAMPGGYVNLLGPDEGDRAADTFGPNTAHLQGVKRRYDPGHTFTGVPLPACD
ncbi:FAD-binding oxidoreductase [Actinoplanes sp. Pm04-4]|uniref:FAD-binding oxidoreductase n=1 Tax=Paractinoplanes pyxinae TaxID=2997416 RepID=A0ABT4AS08_9ACTN|nr:FAD-binding oxidoreductase [Actinoplanes pyxinae]MCY1137033.1 FAD-binding oxidoreductase [Actinoplanes pyxinae]